MRLWWTVRGAVDAEDDDESHSPRQGGGRGGSNKDSEGSNGNITQGGQAYWGDNGYGRGADGVNRTSDGWQNGATGAGGICIVYSF